MLSALFSSNHRCEPVPFHNDVVTHFRNEESELWQFFSQRLNDQAQIEEAALAIIKSTYRLEREVETELYLLCDDVAHKLGITHSITCYQAMDDAKLNARVYHTTAEVHIIFSGPLLQNLRQIELKALLAHELSHVVFNTIDHQQYQIANDILNAMCEDISAHNAYFATARYYNLFKEIYCDRSAVWVVNDFKAVIAMLVKISTQLTEVNVDSYLRQTNEILSKTVNGSHGLTHPEPYLRSRALEIWDQNLEVEDKNSQIDNLIRHKLSLDGIDLLEQKKLKNMTHDLILHFFSRTELQSEILINLAKRYFPEFTIKKPGETIAKILKSIQGYAEGVHEYFAYILLDFALADYELDELPVLQCLSLSEKLQLDELFGNTLKKNINITAKKLATYLEKAKKL